MSSANNNKHPAEEVSLDEPNSKKVKINEDAGEPDIKVTPFLEDIESIQDEIVKLNEKASEEILKVEQKFNALRKPYYEKRNILLKNIPQFWLQTLYNHPNISSMIASEDEEDCLNYLTDLEVEEFEDIKTGYKIKLHFSENPYFKNDVLIKEFHMVAGEYEQAAESTPIEYKDTDKGKSLKQNVESELESLKEISDQKQNAMKSFFAWFLDPIESGTDEIAELIKDQIWPNPLEFYLAQDQAGSDNSDESDDDISEEYENDSHIIQEGELQEIDDEDEEEEGDIESGEEVEEFQQDEGDEDVDE